MNLISKVISKVPKRLKTKKAAFILIILISVHFFLTRGAADEGKIQTAKVERKDLVAEVIASGVVKSDEETILKFPVAGKIIWLGPKDGDFVKKGQVIAKLDREKYEIVLRQSQQNVIAADAELVKVYDKLKSVSAESFDQKIERTAAEAKKNIAVDNLKAAERNLKDSNLVSPISGNIFDVSAIVGQEIQITTEIAKVGNLQKLEFVSEVDETDIAQVREGQKAEISLDAFEGESFESEVFSISPSSVATSTGATAYQVKLGLSSEKSLRLGMNGEVNIEISKKEDVLSVPIEATVDDKFIWVKENNDNYQKLEIEIGLTTDADTEIKSGLREGQEVVISGFDQIGKKSLLQKILGIIS